ncbi:artichoke-like 3 [Homarus americanus]|uniref:Artichoke-like 3 n=1 Tax=Homarus americanus TaxID=6706 RepID=A0A8J5N543_HOMAM|nr:artichoke-like 3 [Homarus americanus]
MVMALVLTRRWRSTEGPASFMFHLLPLLLLLATLTRCATAHPSGRRIGHRHPIVTCPPKAELLPCLCRLLDNEIHIMCENSEEEAVVSTMEALMRRILRVEELHLVGNRIPVLPGRIFGSIQINKLFLVSNEMVGITRNAFAGLESSLQHLFISEPGLHDVPFDTLDNLANLRTCVIENTEISEIPRLYSLSKLEFLKIDGSRVATIPSAAFRFMPNMKKVHIANSQLTGIESNALEGLVYLKEVNFSNNAITWIHPRAFMTLNTVEHLSLGNNRLSDATMAVLAARELRELKILDLSNNLITQLSKGTFVDMPTVEVINLKENVITKIQNGAFFRLPRLRNIDLSGNFLDEFHADVFSESLSMEHLTVARNNLTFLAEMRYIARVLPNLLSLDVSKNRLKINNPRIFEGHGKLEALKVDHNEIEKVPKGLFQQMPNLRELHLSNNFIQSDFDGQVWDLPNLRVLDLSHNDMKRVDVLLLEGLPKLSSLDLSFNVITDVAENTFVGSTFMKNLNMSFNSIAKLHRNIFAGLTELFELELSFNELLTLEDGLFLGLISLEFLHLTHNQIVSINANTFQDTSKLLYLDLSANLVQDLPAEALGKLPSLKVLKLHRNAINQVLDGYLKGLRMVEHLDLSNNHIQVLSQTAFRDMVVLRDLDLSVNYVQNLHPDMFDSMKMLEKLNISHNYITDLGHNTLTSVKRLRILDLTNNSLTELGDAVMGLSSLQGLFISDNYISILKNNSFRDLPNLDILRFDNNGLQTFEPGTFHNLRSLITLDLRNNNLVELNPDSFKSLTSLEELQLSKNQISIIKDFAFTDLTSLRSLELQDNVITEMGAHAFQNMPAMKFLNLSRNGFQDIPEDALQRLPTLDVLDLSWNYLLEVKDSSFRRLEWLTVLMLHDNDLCRLSSGGFTMQRGLRVLTLQNNQLRRLHLHALGNTIMGLSLLDMSGNPFQCDCELVWLRDYLTEDPDDGRGPRTDILGDSLRGVPVCAAPPQYQGLPITQEVCVPRFLDPLLFTAGQTGDALNPGSVNTLLNLANLSETIPPTGNTGPSYLDYNNPILVHELPPALVAASSTSTTEGTTTSEPQTAPPATSAIVQSSSVVSLTTVLPKTEQQAVSSSNIHIVPGNTPTIYAGSSNNINKQGPTTTESSLFGNIKFPTLPNLLDTISNFNIPNIGLNVNWGNLPGFGRHESGSVHKFGQADEDKPMKGPDQNQPIWIEGPGPASPHPLFPHPHPPVRESMALTPPHVTPSREPNSAPHPHHHPEQEVVWEGAPRVTVTPQVPFRGPEVPFVFPAGQGERLQPGVPGFVVPVSRPTNVWIERPPLAQNPHHPIARPVLPSVLHAGPGPSSGTPFLPGFQANQQQQDEHGHPIIISRLPSGASDFSPPDSEEFLTHPHASDILSGGPASAPVPQSGQRSHVTQAKWSPPAVIHPDSGVSHYQPHEPFLPYQPHNPNHPITVVEPPQISVANHETSFSLNEAPRAPTHTTPVLADMSPSESQLLGGSNSPSGAVNTVSRPMVSSPPDQTATGSHLPGSLSSFVPSSGINQPPILSTQLGDPRPHLHDHHHVDPSPDLPTILQSRPTHSLPAESTPTTTPVLQTTSTLQLVPSPTPHTNTISPDTHLVTPTHTQPPPPDTVPQHSQQEPDEPTHSLSDLLGLLYAAEEEVQLENSKNIKDGDDQSPAGVTVLKDIPPHDPNTPVSSPSAESPESSSSNMKLVENGPPSHAQPHPEDSQDDDLFFSRHPMQERPPSRSRPGVVLPVDKSGEPLSGAVPRVPPNNTYISPSKSIGRGGFPTIERVYQPGQEPDKHSVAVQGVDLPPASENVVAEFSHEQPIQETEFEMSEVNAIDWYYNNYYRELASQPVGGNKPPSGATTPAPAHTALLFCLVCIIHNYYVQWSPL